MNNDIMQNREMSLWERLVGIVTRPGAVLQATMEKPAILKTASAISLANLILFLITLPKLQKFTQLSLENMAKQIPPEQLAQSKNLIGAGIAVGGALSAVALPFLGWLVITLLFKFFNLFIGGEAPFKELYAVSVITYVPVVLGGLLRTILVAVSPAENLATVTTSAALVLPKGNIGPLFAFLAHIDPFYIWSLVLLTMGAAMILKTSARKVAVFVVIMWVLWAVAGTVPVLLNPQQIPGA